MKEFTEEECDFILYALNHYWHYCHTELEKKTLGDLERETLKKELNTSHVLIDKIQE